MKRAIAIVGSAAAAGAALFWFGAYDISATDQHLAPTYWLLETGMRRAVLQRAKRIDVPPLDDAAMIAEGGGHYRALCVQCHGGPGVAPDAFALGMLPVPTNLAHAARTRRPAELFWAIREGIKMTGMPAWTFRLDDGQIWSIVAFLRVMPTLSPEQYRKFVESAPAPLAAARRKSAAVRPPDAGRGRQAIHQYACVTCHEIPGIVGKNAPVGPPLGGVSTRAFLAGVLPNSTDAMIRWLMSPQEVSPGNAMPDLGVSEQDAADIAAYLATLD
jgi:mono/diheme cytochrome c family protein